jgi:anti-sigma regulatory factor (Ser/Thr protein kinase)
LVEIPLGEQEQEAAGRAVETAVELDLPVDHRSVREARQFVATFDGLDSRRLADAKLVVSELVTNALEHAGLGPADLIRLSLSRHGSRLRIDIDDAGTFTADSDTFAYPRRARYRRGHGLRTVQALAIRWQAADGRVTAWLDI